MSGFTDCSTLTNYHDIVATEETGVINAAWVSLESLSSTGKKRTIFRGRSRCTTPNFYGRRAGIVDSWSRHRNCLATRKVGVDELSVVADVL